MTETGPYTTALETARSLLERGALRARVRLPYGPHFIQVRLDGDDVGENITELDLDRIELLLSALTAGSGAESFERRIRRDEDAAEAADAAEAYRAGEPVFADLVQQLRERFWVKRTSKTSLLSTLEWELALKLSDDDYSSPADRPLPFATLRFETAPAEPPTLGQTTDALVMSVDQEDVEFLLAVLERLSDVFRASATSDSGVPNDG
jgi:hypothetical protein